MAVQSTQYQYFRTDIVPTSISNQTLTTAVAGDFGTIERSGVLYRFDISDVLVGSGDMILADVQAVTGAKTFDSGAFILAGVTSGTTIINANANASGTITFPAATGIVNLTNLADADIWVGNVSNIATAVTMSGDITISRTGQTTIGAGTVDIAMLSATGTPDASTFLRGDNIWTAPAGGGTWTDTSSNTGTNKTLDDASNTIHADAVHMTAWNASGGDFAVGDAVYIADWNVANALPEILLADASTGVGKPAVGICDEIITNGASGSVTISGRVSNVDTSAVANDGDVMYLSNAGTTGNTLTATRPTGTDNVQRIGVVERDSTTPNGVFRVTGAGRFNDVPNLADGSFWVGNASAVATAVAMSGEMTMDNTGAVTIDDNAITLAKIAHGTAGNLQTFDAAGAPAAVATGTAAQVLTSNGPGAAPTFQASAAGFADPMTTRGDIIVRLVGGTDRLALGTNGQVLQSDGTDIVWGAASGGVPTTITVADESADTTCFVGFFTAATGDLGPKTGTNLTFDSTTGLLTATGFVGPLTGQADTVGTITGLAPDTATTAVAQPNISSIGTLSAILKTDTFGIQGEETTHIIAATTASGAWTYSVPGGDTHIFNISGSPELTISNTTIDLQGNILTNMSDITSITSLNGVAIGSYHIDTQDIAVGTNAVVFGVDAAEPSASTPYITHVGTGMRYNVATGTSHIFRINGVTEYTWDATQFDLQANTLTLDTNQTIVPDAGGLTLNVPTGDTVDIDINSVNELSVSATTVNAPTATFQEAGVDISPIGAHDIPLSATAFYAGTTEGATGLTATEFGAAGNKITLQTWDFTSTAADERIQCRMSLPRNYDNLTVDVLVNWSFASGTGAVRWAARAVAISDNTAIATNFGTAVAANDTAGTAEQLQQTLLSTITIGGSPAAADEIHWEILREGSDGGDTFSATARLHSIVIRITTDAATAA